MWSVYLFQTVNGQIGPRIEVSDLKWSIALNDTEKFSVNLKKSSLPNLDYRYWLDPWWAGVLICWNSQPIVAGPISQRPTETFDEFSLECIGIRGLLARRFAIEEQSDWLQLPMKELAYRDMSLGSIAREVVKVAQTKPAGALPIIFPVLEYVPAGLPPCSDTNADNCYWNPSTMGNGSGRAFYRVGGVTTYLDTIKGKHQRTYKSFNLSNIDIDDILTKLSEVINGPDIMFRPVLISDNRLAFEMWYGTEGNPRLPQTSNIVFDTTTQGHDITDFRVVVSGAYQTHRVFATGAGQDEGTLIRMAQNFGPGREGYPFLESVISASGVEDPDVVLGHSLANLVQNAGNLLEISMNISAEGRYPLGSYQVGDVVELVTKGFLSIPQGTVKARILQINGSDSTQISMNLQTEE